MAEKIPLKLIDLGSGAGELREFADTDTIPTDNIPATLGADKAYRQGNILGTVSETAGVPTGALMEYGTNANGEYWRYADGKQVCTGTTAAQSCATSWLVGGFYNATPCSGTYPAAFSAAPVGVMALCNRAGGTGAVRLTGSGVVDGTTTATPGWRGIAETTGQQISFSYTATGRWF